MPALMRGGILSLSLFPVALLAHLSISPETTLFAVSNGDLFAANCSDIVPPDNGAIAVAVGHFGRAAGGAFALSYIVSATWRDIGKNQECFSFPLTVSGSGLA